MSQHDFDIATGDANTGLTFRAAVNAALQALAGLSSGATAPSTTYAYQLWADTTTGLLKIRNAANSDWITIGTLASTFLGFASLATAQTITAAHTFNPTSTGAPFVLGANAQSQLVTLLNADLLDGEHLATLLASYIEGLTLSNNTSDADHDIDIATGWAINLTGTRYVMKLASTMIKRLDEGWAAGTNQGGLFSGTVANNTWYHVHLIRKDSDGSIDAGFDTSVTAANIPAGYTAYRRLGSVLTDASSNIKGFVQNGDNFIWKVPIYDLAAVVPSNTNAVTKTLTVPTGSKVQAIINIKIIYIDAAILALFTDLDQTDTAPGVNDFGVDNTYPSFQFVKEIWTNASGQIRYRASSTGGSLSIITWGWNDPRGRR